MILFKLRLKARISVDCFFSLNITFKLGLTLQFGLLLRNRVGLVNELPAIPVCMFVSSTSPNLPYFKRVGSPVAALPF